MRPGFRVTGPLTASTASLNGDGKHRSLSGTVSATPAGSRLCRLGRDHPNLVAAWSRRPACREAAAHRPHVRQRRQCDRHARPGSSLTWSLCAHADTTGTHGAPPVSRPGGCESTLEPDRRGGTLAIGSEVVGWPRSRSPRRARSPKDVGGLDRRHDADRLGQRRRALGNANAVGHAGDASRPPSGLTRSRTRPGAHGVRAGDGRNQSISVSARPACSRLQATWRAR